MSKEANKVRNQGRLNLTGVPSVGKDVAKKSGKRALASAPRRSAGSSATRKVKKLTRVGADEYFLKIASVVAERSTCRRHHIGAIAVKDKHILASGYNGAPSAFPDCLELGCLRDEWNIPSAERPEICRGVHAEQNALVQAASFGVSVAGATLYCTNQPCITCAKLLINAGIREIYVKDSYPDKLARTMLAEAGIKVKRIK